MNKNIIDLTGQKFGRLTVISFNRRETRRTLWNCECECGVKTIKSATHLKSGASKSCGCYQRERVSEVSYKHGHTVVSNGKERRTRTYIIWHRMISCCYKSTHKDYEMYGGSGVKTASEWREFSNFLEDLGECPSKGFSLRRIDESKDYCKDNCEWHQRTYVYKKQYRTLQEWSEIVGINYYALKSRLGRGWSIERALEEPVEVKYRSRKG